MGHVFQAPFHTSHGQILKLETRGKGNTEQDRQTGGDNTQTSKYITIESRVRKPGRKVSSVQRQRDTPLQVRKPQSLNRNTSRGSSDRKSYIPSRLGGGSLEVTQELKQGGTAEPSAKVAKHN